ncbi:MAG: VOC family protein [Microthrixaceae bacterium]|nr:VOC family protein [Microthrixaceae bacterium]
MADPNDDAAARGFDPDSLPRVPSADHSLPGQLELGGFSISLNVADLEVSRAFYEKLGFEVTGGDAEGGWLILKNGETTLGLFSGMFERNMLTFNPGLTARMERVDSYTDVREIAKTLADAGIEVDMGPEGDSGPGSIMLTDPDGNPILIDQHF